MSIFKVQNQKRHKPYANTQSQYVFIRNQHVFQKR